MTSTVSGAPIRSPRRLTRTSAFTPRTFKNSKPATPPAIWYRSEHWWRCAKPPDLTYQEILAGNTIVFIFPLCVLLVFLTLAAQYESWSLPLAIILIVPMCLLSAITGIWLRHMDNNIFTQIGLIVLVGLASKNASLIVEFAKQIEDTGKSITDAAVEAARLRLRPILMTSFAFILGVVPLVLASGAGAEMRKALGTTVFFGMLGVTFFGLILTPVFYVVIRKLTARRTLESKPAAEIVINPTPHEAH